MCALIYWCVFPSKISWFEVNLSIYTNVVSLNQQQSGSGYANIIALTQSPDLQIPRESCFFFKLKRKIL